MVPSIDDKKYATDSRLFKDAVLQDGIFKNFENSPITDGLKVSEVCHYKPGDLNKIGKEGRTSWDSFSYAIQMGHNVWHHINAVQEANRQYDNNVIPKMLVDERFDRVYFRDIIEAIFATDNKDTAMAVIEEFNKFWISVIGTRGMTGKRTVNASAQFNSLFDLSDGTTPPVEDDEFTEEHEHKLEELENEQEQTTETTRERTPLST
jgi:hypothetical protein